MFLSSIYELFRTRLIWLWEAPTNQNPRSFGHCPNSTWTPSPTLKRALCGTFFRALFYRFERLSNPSLKKCPKPSWQGFRPPQNRANAQMPPAWIWLGLPLRLLVKYIIVKEESIVFPIRCIFIFAFIGWSKRGICTLPSSIRMGAGHTCHQQRYKLDNINKAKMTAKMTAKMKHEAI